MSDETQHYDPPAYPPNYPGGYAPAYAPAYAPKSRPAANPAAATAVVGLGAALVGCFALAVQDYGKFRDFISFTTYREYAATVSGKAGDVVFGGVSQFWWRFGLLGAAIVLIVLVGAVALRPSAVAGVLLALVAVATGVLHALAYAQTEDYVSIQEFRRDGPSMFAHPGIGIWVALAGLLVTAVGGLLAIRRPGPRSLQ